MSATFTWTIQWMKCVPQSGQYTDVVVTAGWTCSGSQVSGDNTYSSQINGTSEFKMPTGTFTPYDQLTENQVLGWVWTSGTSQSVTEQTVQDAINNLITPPIVELPLPWAAPTA